MELSGAIAIPAPRERVWAALNDPVVLQACIPGCEEVVDESATVRKARVLVKVGPVRARFNGRVTVSEATPPQSCVMGFEGSGGAAGIASGSSRVELHEDGDNTRLTYTVKAAVGGKLGQVGGRMIDASAKQLADQFFDALRVHVAPPQPQSPVNEQVGTGAAVEPAVPAELQRVTPSAASTSAVPVAAATSESTRVLWFLLGAAATGFGVWLARVLA